VSDRRHRRLIWIVDDSPTEALIAERSLGSRYDFETFADGSVVVERLAAGGRQPDLVLLDWVMPGMAGDEVCRFLRTDPRTAELPIILITASRLQTADITHGFASGANDYLVRPFAPEELRARVDSAIRTKHLSDSINLERERTSRFQQQMLGIVGHDLRTPLGAILMGTEMLGEHVGGSSEARSILSRIESSASRMTRMVEQLLDVTRARLGEGIPVAPRITELVPLVRSVIEELALARTKARLELVATSDVSGIWDPDRIGQVVSNVISNAIQYGKENAPIVVAVSSSDVAATITVHNAIRDKPIPPEMLATLFDPYRRGPDTAHNASGLGLGLYIVHEIVRAHGGTLEVESVAAGTTFRVVLPKAGSHAAMT